MVLTPGGGSNRNPSPRNDQRASDVYVNGRGSRTLVPSSPGKPRAARAAAAWTAASWPAPWSGTGARLRVRPVQPPRRLRRWPRPLRAGRLRRPGLRRPERLGRPQRLRRAERAAWAAGQERLWPGPRRRPEAEEEAAVVGQAPQAAGQRPAHQGAADGAQAGQRRPGRDGPARDHRHGVRVDRLHRQLVLRRLLPPRQRERDSQDGRGPVPADRHAADRVCDGVPAEPARVLLPDAHAPPGDPRQPGPVLRHQAPDTDHDHPLLPGGRAGHHGHAADGRAPGVPRQVGSYC